MDDAGDETSNDVRREGAAYTRTPHRAAICSGIFSLPTCEIAQRTTAT